MKTARLFFALSFLAVLLPGCFNPITAIPPKTGDPEVDPFTIDVMIGKDGSARAVAGPDIDRIKGDARNIIQLIVVDNQTKQIAAFDEVRREKESDTEAALVIDSIPFGKTYDFLLLMGHWERDYGAESGGNYVYKEANPPTLLAAGLKEYPVTGSGKVTVVVWPLVVDTKFETSNTGVPSAARTAAPVMNAGRPGKVNLLPVDWSVTWTLRKGVSGNGLEELIRAQKVIDGNAGNDLLVAGKTTRVRGDGLNDAEAVVSSSAAATNVITLPIGPAYTSAITRIGRGGSVNFKLEYVPFNLTSGSLWSGYNGKSAFTLDGSKAPVWIIRNGVNDDPQDGSTDFANLGKAGHAAVNGNGAVSFVTAADAADPDHPKAGDLVIRDGKFAGPSNSTAPKITFITEGYTGTAEVHYAVVPAPGSGAAVAPGYSAYTGSLDSVAATVIPVLPDLPVPHNKSITLPGTDGYDVYVVLFKDGKVSAPVKISTTAGGQDVDWNWGKSGFVTFAFGSGEAAGSDDGGKTWTAAAALPAGYWREAVYGDGVFAAIASGGGNSDKVVWSDDGGETWTEAAMPSPLLWHSLAYGDGVFVTLAASNDHAAWSNDGGKTWTAAALPGVAQWQDVTYGGGVFAAVAYNSSQAAWSGDGGKTWTAAALPSSTYWSSVAYGDGVFAAVAGGSSNKAAWSVDGGKTWTAAALPKSAAWNGVTYGDGVFVVVGRDSDKAAWSNDGGKTWTAAALPSHRYWEDAAYGDGVFVTVASGSDKAAWSNDGGKTWTAAALPSSASWTIAAYGAP